MEDKIANAILQLAKVHNQRGGEIAKALENIATQLKWLGNGNAMGEGGAIEFLGAKIHDGLESVSTSISELASAVDQKENM